MNLENRELLRIKDIIIQKFTREHWLEIGLITDTLELVKGHGRLLRSLDWNDDDYSGNALGVLMAIFNQAPQNRAKVAHYIDEKFPGEAGLNISSDPGAQRIVFSPSVFKVPSEHVEEKLVSVMMPFAAEFKPVYQAICDACEDAKLECRRADDIWVESVLIQDIFRLIFISQIVISDFTGRNPNVLYETGIAHTLGKKVVPITQDGKDIPFDLAHHRYLSYLANGEGLAKLRSQLKDRLTTIQRTQ